MFLKNIKKWEGGEKGGADTPFRTMHRLYSSIFAYYLLRFAF